MTTFLEDESSVESSQPEEFWLITYGVTTHRIAVGNRDLQVGSFLYTATAGARSEIQMSSSGSIKEVSISLPSDHAMVARYLLQGLPPENIWVTIYRRQVVSNATEQLWKGKVTSMSCEKSIARFRIPSRSGQVALRVIPNYTAGRACPHILYSTPCGLDRNNVLFKKDTTVIYVNGRLVKFDKGDTASDNWSKNGFLIHNPTGYKRTIYTQTYVNLPSSVVEIEMQAPIPELRIGDSITVHAGCDHTLAQCIARFDNRVHYGGFPHLPTKSIFAFSNRLVV